MIKSSIDQEKATRILELRKNKVFLREIAKEIGVSQPTISKFLRNGCIPLKEWKYEVDESFFEKIDTPEKAYFLGWIAADGSLSKAGTISLSLNEQDEDVLVLLRGLIKGDKPIKRYKIKGYKNLYSCYSITNKKIFKDILNFGVHPDKTKTVFIPESLDMCLFKYYLRGFFEGDGCIYLSKKINQIEVSIVGQSERIFEQIRQMVLDETGLCGNMQNKVHKLKNGKKSYIIDLRYSGNKKGLSFLTWLYSGEEHLFLKRKKSLYLDRLKSYRNSTRSITFPIIQLNKDDSIEKRWRSAKEASVSLGISQSTVLRLCSSNGEVTYGGFRLKFEAILFSGVLLKDPYSSSIQI